MSQEIFQIMKEMNTKQVGTQLALQCAPLLIGIKMSNLLILDCELRDELLSLLSGTEITAYELFEFGGKSYYFLYCEEDLEAYLSLPEIKDILFREGYQKFGLSELFCRFCFRYQEYTKGRMEFPHEMGAFLGYPAEDVTGFIENDGKNFLYSGYWKVYDRVSEKKLLFQQFERAREIVIEMVSCGWNIRDIVLENNNLELLKAAV